MILFMVPVGIAIATNVLVGNNIGAFKIELAKFYARMCFLAGFVWAIASVLAIWLFQNQLIELFTTDPATQE